jgi:hypothetical protein
MPGDGMTAALRRAAQFASRHPSVPVALFVALYGFTITDANEYRAISANPFVLSLGPEYQFLYTSPLTFFLGSYYQHHGVEQWTSFLIVAGLGLLLFALAVRAWRTSRFAPEDRAAATTILLSSPLLFVIVFWVGKSDVYLLAFFLLLVASESGLTRSILATLMVCCHRELGAAVLIAYLCLDTQPWRSVGAGLLVGELALLAYTQHLLPAPPQSRAEYWLAHRTELFAFLLAHPIWHLVGTLGPFWLLLAWRRRITIREAGVLLGALALAAFAIDFTRIFVIAAAPVLLAVTTDVVAALRRDGGLRLGRARVPAYALWLLMLVQVQLAGPKVFWVRGAEIVLK